MWPGASQVVLVVKNPPARTGDRRDVSSIPGSGRFPGEANGYPLQYSCPENPMDRGAWQATVHRVSKSQTWLKWLSTHTCHLNLNVAWMSGYVKCLEGCPGSEGDWWRPKILSYTCTLLFCYLTVVVEKLYGEIRLSGSLVHNAREQHKGWPSQSGQKEEPNLEWPFHCASSARKELKPLPSVGCVSPGFVYWSSFNRKFIFDPWFFSQKKTLSTCFSWFSHGSHLGEEAEF